MNDKPKLKLIKPDPGPKRSCRKGGACGSNASEDCATSCEWWLNHKESHYCFWTYVLNKSDENGMMKELVQSELAQLFGWSDTKTHFVLKQAIEELTVALRKNGAEELLTALEEGSDESSDPTTRTTSPPQDDDFSE